MVFQTFQEYFSNAPGFESNYLWKLPKNTSFQRGISINVPRVINLDTFSYARLYSLMASEGYTKTEFSLHVPEPEFHDLFKKCLFDLCGGDVAKRIRIKKSKGFLRSRAHYALRHVIPTPKYIPKIILEDKELSREYLRVAFEAEGSAIFDGQSKRYIKLTRNVDITSFVNNKINYPVGKRIYTGKFKKDHPKLYTFLLENPPKLLLGEHLLLKHYFDIDSKLTFEAIRINNTSTGFGKITARWVLLIYANNIDKFIKEIGFMLDKKKKITDQMKKVPGRRPQYSSFEIIRKVQKKHIFYSNNFIKEMKKISYVSPWAYLSRYIKKGLIKKVSRGKYKIISYPPI